ncbi:hypothetical protein DXG01_014886 [Tephrocybe rancida]|nr:hypothetical protein DXG01_014886 [Tephrocybe rancida]
MPVTFPIAPHPAERFAPTHAQLLHNEAEILGDVITEYTPARILQSSVPWKAEEPQSRGIIVQRNGFVQGVVLAYNKHHNLVIRDTKLMAPISINAHAEELRDKFVSHSGRIELRVTSESTTVEGMDFGDLAVQMSREVGKKVKDASLVPWVLPNFSTTTPDDSVICSVLLMSTLKKYFTYRLGTLCGIPYLTLLGTQSDWQSLLSRISKLSEFGAEPTEWSHMLRAILTRFVRAFDDGFPTGPDAPFWARMVHEESGSGTYWLGGWISAFCAWDAQGVFFADRDKDTAVRLGVLARVPTPAWARGLEVDGCGFPRVSACPEGYAEVSVRVVDGRSGERWACRALAGHVGIEVMREGDGEEEREGGDTIRMAPQWFVYVKGKPGKKTRHYLPF